MQVDRFEADNSNAPRFHGFDVRLGGREGGDIITAFLGSICDAIEHSDPREIG